MEPTPPDVLHLPVFGGQGAFNFYPSSASRCLLYYTSFSAGAFLLDACYDAFHAELVSLPADILEKVNICAIDFENKATLLCPLREEYVTNPIVSGTTLLLVQCLEYLAYLEGYPGFQGKRSSLLDLLRLNAEHGVGALGFSSGVLSACVVASSGAVVAFVSKAVEAYRLAFWIGIRCQVFRVATLGTDMTRQDLRPWAMVVLSVDKSVILEIISSFNRDFDTDRIHISAVIDDNCVTISGHPDDLALFTPTLPDEAQIHETNINALYHCPSRLLAVRQQVLGDASSRVIHFPTFEDLLIPVRSSFTGEPLSKSASHETLLDLVVDMVILQPVYWNVVIERTVACVPRNSHIHLLNLGLGKTLVKGLEQALLRQGAQNVVRHDVSNEDVWRAAEVNQSPIAIIGMGLNMPGAQTADELWEILSEGRNTAEEIPSSRFDFEAYTEGRIPGRVTKSFKANFIEGADEFDHRFFNVSPREAKSMDPQQRILLRVAHEALEDAGYTPYGSPAFSPETFGCYIGASTHDYALNLRNNIDVYYSTGTLTAFLSGRLSYCLGLNGPSMVVDTACSSSAVAIYQAARALMNGDCNAALAGGVNVISSPDMFLGLDRGHFLSPGGKCRSFDAAADGYSRAEGCGVFVLKRLSDAVAENDRILGVIRGIEVNQSGLAQSITHPHAPTLKALFKQVLRKSGVDANSVNLVEAHGTGTQAGDTNEMESIRHVLSSDRQTHNPLYVTAIKANIGHLEAASGCASLAKVLVMFRRQMIPQQILFETLNPRINPLESDNIIISKTNRSWPQAEAGKPRLALINNFGAAGSNTTLLIEEYNASKLYNSFAQSPSYVFGISAKDEGALDRRRLQFIKWLQDPQNDDKSLLDLAYTLTARRQVYAHRMAVVASAKQDLITQMQQTPAVELRPDSSSSVIFVFSGQGPQSRDMAPSLYKSSPTFRSCIDECNAILTSSGFHGILSVVIGPPGDIRKTLESAQEHHAATFALQYALSRLWISWGIRPAAVMGHSLGEYAALVTAGVLDLRDALVVVATRARLMFERCTSNATSMVAVSLGPVKLQAILDNTQHRLSNCSVACFNSPQDCVVSGPIPELERLKHYLDDEYAGKYTQLDVPYGYHSPAMSPLVDDLVAIGRKINARSPSLPVVSTAFGRVIMPGDLAFCDKDYFARHCAQPVRLVEAIHSYLSSPGLAGGKTAYLEIGPHPAILPMLKAFPRISSSLLLPSLHKRMDCWTSLSKTLASFFLIQTINWAEVFSQIGPTTCLSLPSYPFSKRRFWVPYEEHSPGQITNQNITFSLLRKWQQYPCATNGSAAVLETTMDDLKLYIEGHRVVGVPLCPASIYLELASASAVVSLQYLAEYPKGYNIALHQVSFSKPLTRNYGDEKDMTSLKIRINTKDKAFIIGTDTSSTHHAGTHAAGGYQLLGNQEVQDEFDDLMPFVSRQLQGVLAPGNARIPETFSTRTAYKVIFPRVVDYSKEFHTMQSLAMSSDGMEAAASVRIDDDSDSRKFVTHPLFLDTLIHVAGFVCNLHGGQSYAYICNEIASLTVLSSLLNNAASYSVYCKMEDAPGQGGITGDSYAILESMPRKLVAHAKGIRFQRVRLSGLKSSLVNLAGLSTPSSLRVSEDGPNPVEKSTSAVVTTVLQVVARACNIDVQDISVRQDLDTYGVDSLMRLEVCYDLSKAFPSFGYRSDEMSACRTIQDIVDLISSNPLPNKYAEERTSVPSTPCTLVSNGSPLVKRVFARVLEVEEEAIKEDVDLETLGLDSLTSIEASHILSTQYRINMPLNVVSPRRTIRDIEHQLFPFAHQTQLLSNSVHENASHSSLSRLKAGLGLDQRVWSLQTSTSKHTPLVLIHDGSGLAASYQHILDLDRSVFGINNPNFATSHPWVTISQMAKSYATFVLERMTGPVILGGWSFGGVVAFEVAKVLQSRSIAVKGVILIDSPDPFVHVPLSVSIIDDVLDTTRNLDPEVRRLCKQQFAMNTHLLGKYDPYESCNYGAPPRVIFLRSMEDYRPAGKKEIPPPWLSDRSDPAAMTRGWETLSGSPIRSIDIPGNHFQPFERQNIVAVTRRIADACEMLDI